jgi:tetratricopeptide (TPR) repeat protein
MVSIRPDIRSYSRIAYLREIYGDIAGAIEAMELAVVAGTPGDENTEWCRVQMGKLYEQIGKTKDAAMQYTIAAENRMYYPYALAGLARIATEEKNYDKALALYMQADSLLPDHTFKEGQADIYELMGQPDKAKLITKEILAYVKKLTVNNKNSVGQNEDHEMAHAYMGVGDLDLALKYALVEYNRRPDNIEVNETVAIVYYKRKEYAKALPYIERALKTNSKKPELLFYTGLIYVKTGNKIKGQQYLDETVRNNPGVSDNIKLEIQ